jgi:hypothetical protein
MDRELRRGCVWNGEELQSGIGWVSGEALGTLLQALLGSGGQEKHQTFYPIMHLLKIPTR